MAENKDTVWRIGFSEADLKKMRLQIKAMREKMRHILPAEKKVAQDKEKAAKSTLATEKKIATVKKNSLREEIALMKRKDSIERLQAAKERRKANIRKKYRGQYGVDPLSTPLSERLAKFKQMKDKEFSLSEAARKRSVRAGDKLQMNSLEAMDARFKHEQVQMRKRDALKRQSAAADRKSNAEFMAEMRYSHLYRMSALEKFAIRSGRFTREQLIQQKKLRELRREALRHSGQEFRTGRLLGGLALTGMVGGATIGGATAAGRMISERQSQRSSYSAIFGGDKQGAAQLNWIKKQAMVYGVAVNDIAKSYVKLTSAAKSGGISQETVRGLFTSFNDVATVLGLTNDEVAGSIFAFQQMLSKGKVSMEELRRQLGERFPPVMEIFAKAQGVSVEQFDKLVSTGKIYSKDILPKVVEVMKNFYPQSAVNKGLNTLAKNWQRIKNIGTEIVVGAGDKGLTKSFQNFQNMLENFLKGASPELQGFLAGLGKILDGFTTAFGQMGTVVKHVLRVINPLLDKFGFLLGYIVTFLAGGAAIKALKWIVTAGFGPFGASINWLLMLLTGRTAGGLAGGLIGVFGKLIALSPKLSKVFSGIAKGIKLIGLAIKSTPIGILLTGVAAAVGLLQDLYYMLDDDKRTVSMIEILQKKMGFGEAKLSKGASSGERRINDINFYANRKQMSSAFQWKDLAPLREQAKKMYGDTGWWTSEEEQLGIELLYQNLLRQKYTQETGMAPPAREINIYFNDKVYGQAHFEDLVKDIVNSRMNQEKLSNIPAIPY